jgi:serine/threonine protein kinase
MTGSSGGPPDFSLDERLAKSRVKRALLDEPQPAVRLGCFEIVGCLGRGGQGSVYRAHDTRHRMDVALKYLHVASWRRRCDLEREFRSGRALSHPNLVALHELFVSAEHAFFTMEWVRGTDLLDYVNRAKASPERVRILFAALLAAIEAIHAAGKIHRDLKPANVLVSTAGRLVVLDYGLMIDEKREVLGTFASGTPSYMAPEQKSAVEVGPASDLYAIGKMLSECVILMNPVRAEVAELIELSRDLQSLAPRGRPTAREALSRL